MHGGYAVVAADRIAGRVAEVFDALAADAPLRDTAGNPPATTRASLTDCEAGAGEGPAVRSQLGRGVHNDAQMVYHRGTNKGAAGDATNAPAADTRRLP